MTDAEKIAQWPKRIPGTHYGCIVLAFTADHKAQRATYYKGDVLTIAPERWSNRTDESFTYTGEEFPLSKVKFLADQRIPEHLRIENYR